MSLNRLPLLSLAMESVRILRRRQPKHLCVVTAKLSRTFIADLESSRHDTLRISDHQCSGLEQAYALLILQWTQVGHGLEVAMERRDAHRRALGQARDANGLGEVLPYPLDRKIHSGHRAVGRRDLSQHPAKRALKHAEDNLSLVHRRQRCDGIASATRFRGGFALPDAGACLIGLPVHETAKYP